MLHSHTATLLLYGSIFKIFNLVGHEMHFEIVTRHCNDRICVIQATGVRVLTFHPDGKTLFCGYDDNLKVRTLDEFGRIDFFFLSSEISTCRCSCFCLGLFMGACDMS